MTRSPELGQKEWKEADTSHERNEQLEDFHHSIWEGTRTGIVSFNQSRDDHTKVNTEQNIVSHPMLQKMMSEADDRQDDGEERLDCDSWEHWTTQGAHRSVPRVFLKGNES
jgi:hypothetical protein